jgi:hypothetical protein
MVLCPKISSVTFGEVGVQASIGVRGTLTYKDKVGNPASILESAPRPYSDAATPDPDAHDDAEWFHDLAMTTCP